MNRFDSVLASILVSMSLYWIVRTLNDGEGGLVLMLACSTLGGIWVNMPPRGPR